MDLKEQVIHYLKTGRENALTGKQLATLCNEKDTRSIRLAIVDLVETQHIPILGTEKGYYRAESLEECQKVQDTLHSYGISALEHEKYLGIAAREYFAGQLKLRF
jgi:hypothetical protein